MRIDRAGPEVFVHVSRFTVLVQAAGAAALLVTCWFLVTDGSRWALVAGVLVGLAVAVSVTLVARTALGAPALVVDGDGLSTLSVLGRRRVPWEEIDGFELTHNLSVVMLVMRRPGQTSVDWQLSRGSAVLGWSSRATRASAQELLDILEARRPEV